MTLPNTGHAQERRLREGASVFLAGRTLATLEEVAETARVDALDDRSALDHPLHG
jgi:hypothetical protein